MVKSYKMIVQLPSPIHHSCRTVNPFQIFSRNKIKKGHKEMLIYIKQSNYIVMAICATDT